MFSTLLYPARCLTINVYLNNAQPFIHLLAVNRTANEPALYCTHKPYFFTYTVNLTTQHEKLLMPAQCMCSMVGPQ